MHSDVQTAPVSTSDAPTSKNRLWAGRIISGLIVAFCLFDAAIKIFELPPALEGTMRLGYPASTVVPIGILLLACVALYAVPRTSILGAVLLTGYLGGAVASNVRVANPLFGYTLFPVYVGVLLWLGLYLRNERLREFIPLVRV
jgi:DoxX-like family